jgi:hypothetical protein
MNTLSKVLIVSNIDVPRPKGAPEFEDSIMVHNILKTVTPSEIIAAVETINPSMLIFSFICNFRLQILYNMNPIKNRISIFEGIRIPSDFVSISFCIIKLNIILIIFILLSIFKLPLKITRVLNNNPQEIAIKLNNNPDFIPDLNPYENLSLFVISQLLIFVY